MLGDPRFAATRINLAQSCNGVGWICGPIIGSMYFYSKDARATAPEARPSIFLTSGIAVVVIVLAVIFYFANIPDIKTRDDYHLDDSAPGAAHSIWSHPHFVMAVVAQFFYVAAQAGIFSFFINYMTSEVPPIPGVLETAMAKHLRPCRLFAGWLLGWFETNAAGVLALSNKGASNIASLGLVCFLAGRFTGAGLLKKFCRAQDARHLWRAERGRHSAGILEAGLDLGSLRIP